jgi:hypothetical protein
MTIQLDCLAEMPLHPLPKEDVATTAERAFVDLTARLEDLCLAETDLDCAPFADIAFDDWFRDAEAARTAAITAARFVRYAPAIKPTDVYLATLGKAFETMMLTTDPKVYRRLHDCFVADTSSRPATATTGCGIGAAKSLQMFRFQIARLLTFEDYLPEAISLERAVPDEIAPSL